MKRPLITAALVAALLATPAFAASDKFEMAVTFDRAAAESPEGARVEYKKINEEVVERCAAEHADIPVRREFATTLCKNRTMNTVVKSIDSPELTKVHAAKKAS
ncbi:UrcA family protein [Hyphomonas sp.]|jgi:UrcA family protein|uniref:UrcA family protein n=1 Tax=Hyphomonas sp. TaxID=87 RepID=UPI0039E50E2F